MAPSSVTSPFQQDRDKASPIGHNPGILGLKRQLFYPIQINPPTHTAANTLGKPGVLSSQLLFDLG